MHKTDTLAVRAVGLADMEGLLPLAMTLNPHLSKEVLQERFEALFEQANYHCFGLFEAEQLIGMAGAWLNVRLYSGWQVEIDNVVVAETSRSGGKGQYFLQWLEAWAKAQGCHTLELNTYVQNSRSHKFYFQNGYAILGYHFQKKL